MLGRGAGSAAESCEVTRAASAAKTKVSRDMQCASTRARDFQKFAVSRPAFAVCVP